MKNKLFIISCLSGFMVVAAIPAFAQKKEKSSTISSVYTNDESTTLDFTKDGHHYKVKMTGKQVTELYRDDIKIASEDYAKYDSLIKEVLKEVEEQREEADKMRAEAEVHRKQADQHRAEAEVHRKEAEKHRAQADEQRAEADKHRLQGDESRKQAEALRADSEKQRAEAEGHRKHADEMRAQADIHRKEAEKHREQAEKDRATMEKMLDEIVAEKIVANRDDLKSMLLDKNEFSVNGVKQSEKLHQQFKEKYLKGTQLKFQVNGSFRGVSVQ